MRLTRCCAHFALIATLLTLSGFASAQSSAKPNDANAIIAMLNGTAVDWNRGDLDAFAKGYKNSPDILFMGQTIQHGYGEMLARYRKSYPNKAAMGELTFSELQVQPLDDHFATVTGRFHLERTAAGGGNAGGYFLLVVEKTPAGWKIIRDDTTGDSPTKH